MLAANAYQDNDNGLIQKIKNEIGITDSHTHTQHRTLFVDPSDLTVRLCLEALFDFDINFGKERDGIGALQRLLREKFDSVIVALHSPIINAIDLVFILRNIEGPNRNIPFFIITSNSVTEFDPRVNLAQNIFKKDKTLAINLKNAYQHLAARKSLEENPRDLSNIPFKKLFLVDDETAIHDLVGLAIKKFPALQLAGTTNPLDAIKLIKEFKPDLILTDSQMAAMAGEQLCQKIREDSLLKDLPIFFLTAENNIDELKKIMASGATAIIQKPFRPASLLQQILSHYRSFKSKKVA